MLNPSVVSSRCAIKDIGMMNKAADSARVIVNHHGDLENYTLLSPAQKILHRKEDAFTIFFDKRTLVLKNSFDICGFHINTKSTLLVAPARDDVRSFITYFFNRSGVDYITEGDLISSLIKTTRIAVVQNLMALNVLRTPKNTPIRNISRYEFLSSRCKLLGLVLFSDELIIESISPIDSQNVA